MNSGKPHHYRLLWIVVLLALAVAQPIAADFFDRGERAFLNNEPEDAAALLEVAIQNQPGRSQAYIYLGIAYTQLGYLERAADILTRGIERGVDKKEQLYHNLGIVRHKLGDPEGAEEAYRQAVRHNSSYSPSYLNRANLRVRQGGYQDALQDYRVYLNLAPDGPESDNVRRMIAALENEIADERARAERERVAREEAERQAEREAEEERRRQEEERLAAEQRRQELLGSVLESLEGTGREADPLGAATEDFEDFDFELGREN
ncbi:tetratricopeptide repeat protein [Spirochaeta africana]|uniref:Cytochrome c biogenesis factor n=1 Tax=Spirochaeta africana (strain ATCC 700263 / DSM 8902 / Z-7692) TaxID=889378 RepID=H9UJ20_SPIAZ|nr:tetratricopeptide repeat protein [Spirochaeta africana]AFG37513.1 cytochrome c biogenesis factor [Spirochaeta africana DSM 8902]